ncbi:regulatory protein NPR1 isoform X2 [Eutrema salsugineum]|uniref:regulatory protein NPR1 isoform X2 n=1 Tax=Eutrema salsugineum TaxID=72664 RepID=UPI000CED0F4D|nr:regulatory protein NPR1 isoform X2 [Eutrema salsugineum]
MDNIAGFSDSYEISNTSSTSFFATPAPTEKTESSIVYPSEVLAGPEVSAYRLLSNSFESVFDSPEAFYSDAYLVLADGREVSFHRCVLSARSPFFKSALAAAEKEQKSTVAKLELKKIATDYDVGFDSVVAVLAYVYCGRVRPPPKGVSECADDNCCHVACRPAVDFMVEVLYLAFVFEIPELITLYQRHLLDVVDKVIVEDTLFILKLANICGKTCMKLLEKCREIIVKSNVDIVSLKKSLPQHIVKQIVDIRKELGFEAPEPEKHVSNIHKALESDDVALVVMLLNEGHTNLDDAYALHFAVAYCDVKTATDLLKLELADVNHRNARGYTVLHVAAMRKEPNLIALLLTKGANASEISFDGRTALLIAKQVTKAAEYNYIPEQGKPSSKGRLCVEILEQPDKRDPFPADVSPSLAEAADVLKIRLIDLENRVQMARCLFPMEAQVAMDIAQMNGTCEFVVTSLDDCLIGGKRASPDQYMAPFEILETHRSRLRALSKTVEFGKRFFPRCSAELDEIMDSEDLSILACIEEDTPEQRLQKRQRYMEIQKNLQNAFSKDKEELGKSSPSASSSSTSKSTATKGSNAAGVFQRNAGTF